MKSSLHWTDVFVIARVVALLHLELEPFGGQCRSGRHQDPPAHEVELLAIRIENDAAGLANDEGASGDIPAVEADMTIEVAVAGSYEGQIDSRRS